MFARRKLTALRIKINPLLIFNFNLLEAKQTKVYIDVIDKVDCIYFTCRVGSFRLLLLCFAFLICLALVFVRLNYIKDSMNMLKRPIDKNILTGVILDSKQKISMDWRRFNIFQSFSIMKT